MKLLFTTILFFYAIGDCLADMVDNGSKQFYGIIIYVDMQQIQLKQGCGSTVTTFYWNPNLSITFNTQCDHPGWDMSRSPVSIDDICPKKKVFRFLIKSSNRIAYAEKFVQANHILTITYINGQGSQQIAADDIDKYIEWVMCGEECVQVLPQSTPTL